ncbi:hypothetical protein TNCV_4559101 [Trichonephila clavipes]|nr:hypothetical protein TNCV_4559101 [Trichonephila clavipes]
MTSHNRLDNSRGLELASLKRSWLDGYKWSPGYGINSKQMVLSPGTSTKIPLFACDLAVVSGRKISRQTVYSRLEETGLYARRPVWCVPLTASSRKDRISRS